MPRDASGNYTLPTGNPVVGGTVIEASWANPTMNDIGAELTESLDRSGRGGMKVPFRVLDGSVGAPAFSFTGGTTSGLYRAGTNDIRMATGGVDLTRWISGPVPFEVWNGTAFVAVAITGGDAVFNDLTVTGVVTADLNGATGVNFITNEGAVAVNGTLANIQINPNGVSIDFDRDTTSRIRATNVAGAISIDTGANIPTALFNADQTTDFFGNIRVDTGALDSVILGPGGNSIILEYNEASGAMTLAPNTAGSTSFGISVANAGVNTPAFAINSVGHLLIQAEKRLYFDGVGNTFGNTYITESAPDTLQFVTNGLQMMKLSPTGISFNNAGTMTLDMNLTLLSGGLFRGSIASPGTVVNGEWMIYGNAAGGMNFHAAGSSLNYEWRDAAGLSIMHLGPAGLGVVDGFLVGDGGINSGTNSAPAYSFVGDTDTGAYLAGNNNYRIATGGIRAFEIDVNQDVFIAQNLDVQLGDLTVSAGTVSATAVTQPLLLNCTTTGGFVYTTYNRSDVQKWLLASNSADDNYNLLNASSQVAFAITQAGDVSIPLGSLTVSAGTLTVGGTGTFSEVFANTGTRGIKLSNSVGSDSGIVDTIADHDLEFRRNNITMGVFDSTKALTLQGNINVQGQAIIPTAGNTSIGEEAVQGLQLLGAGSASHVTIYGDGGAIAQEVLAGGVAIRMANLAGTGSRTVVAAADGTLSAP